MTAGSALVIGANGGMGTAVARALLGAGYEVSATVSRPDAVASFGEVCPGCREVETLDLGYADDVKERLVGLVGRMERLDAVIVCAAVAPFAPAETTSLAVFRRTMEINCVSNLAIYQACLPSLRQTGGRLVLTSSWSGKIATPVMASYVASKFALEGLCDVMRQEAQAWGVEVVLIQPGALDTQMMRRSQAALADAIAALDPHEAVLYGTLYRQMKYRADEGLANANYSSPEIVADAVLAALRAEQPSPRYPVGRDTESLFELARTLDDRAMDAFILEMYRSAPVESWGAVEDESRGSQH